MAYKQLITTLIFILLALVIMVSIWFLRTPVADGPDVDFTNKTDLP